MDGSECKISCQNPLDSNGRCLRQSLSWRMVSSGMLRSVAHVRTDVSEELSASIIRVTRIGELGTTLALTSNRVFLRSVRRLLVTASVVPSSPILVTLMKEVLSSSETSVLTRATRHNIPEVAILHSHRRENLKSYRVYPIIIDLYIHSPIRLDDAVLNLLNKRPILFLPHSISADRSGKCKDNTELGTTHNCTLQ
jgi:hypothetical protein